MILFRVKIFPYFPLTRNINELNDNSNNSLNGIMFDLIYFSLDIIKRMKEFDTSG